MFKSVFYMKTLFFSMKCFCNIKRKKNCELVVLGIYGYCVLNCLSIAKQKQQKKM